MPGSMPRQQRPEMNQVVSEYLRNQYFPGGDLQSQLVRLTLYRLLAAGQPVPLYELARESEFDLATTEQVIASVEPTRLRFDAEGQITAFAGLSLAPTNHQLETDTSLLHTWCVFDALFLPEILDCRARISSKCPATGQDIRLDVDRTEVQSASPTNLVMSFIMPSEQARCDDLRSSFCNHVNFFTSRDVAAPWLAENPAGELLTLDEAMEMAAVRNHQAFGLAVGKVTE
jgi:alkylmercury lyase